MKQRLSKEKKLGAVKRYQNGERVKAIAREYGVCEATLYNWIKSFNESECEGKNAKSLHVANLKLKKLYEILEITKLVGCTAIAPLKERLYALEKLKEKYSVYSLCEALNVDRGTFYNHIKRAKKQDAWYYKYRENIKKSVKEVYEGSNQIYGANKITAVLRARGVNTSTGYVRSIMREIGILSISSNSKTDYHRLNSGKRTDKVNMNFSPTAPNEVWVSDTTSFKIMDKAYHICVIMDLYARRVVGYKISAKNSTNLVAATFRCAYSERAVENLIFHSDRGCQYTAYGFVKLLKQHGVTQSFSPSGSPYHNAVIESFFSYLKREEIYRKAYRSVNEFKSSIDRYMLFYNQERPHSYIKYSTPEEYEKQYYNKLEQNVEVPNS